MWIYLLRLIMLLDRKTLLLTSFCSPLTIITFIKKIYIYINSCKQFIYYEKGDFKHNERNSRKLNKYQSRISSTFSARLPLIFIHRANWLSLIKQARHRRRPTNIVFHREEGEESGSHFPEFTGKSVWKGWRLKITNGRTCIREKRRKEEKRKNRALPRFHHPRFESRRVNRRGIPVRGWFRTRRWSLSPDLDFTCRGGKESLRTFANPSKPVTRHWLTFYGPESGYARLIHMPATFFLAIVSFSLNIEFGIR